MNIIDSTFWLEYFADTDDGNIVAGIIENTDVLIVPSITIYEVFKKILIERTENDALIASTQMKQGNVIVLDEGLALEAAKISKKHKMPMADSIIYATSLKYNCLLWTQDKHFMDLEFVNYFEKKK